MMEWIKPKRVDVIEVPEAVKRKFIENAPDNIYSIKLNEYYNQYRSRKIKLLAIRKKRLKNGWIIICVVYLQWQ